MPQATAADWDSYHVRQNGRVDFFHVVESPRTREVLHYWRRAFIRLCLALTASDDWMRSHRLLAASLNGWDDKAMMKDEFNIDSHVPTREQLMLMQLRMAQMEELISKDAVAAHKIEAMVDPGDNSVEAAAVRQDRAREVVGEEPTIN